MDSFLKRFSDRNEAELRWLGELYQCVEAAVCPAGTSVEQLALAVVRVLQQMLDSRSSVMPLSYSFVSVSDLVARQNVPCCSHLTWSTCQYREWAEEAEQLLPYHKALPRANLLLIGYLTDRECASQSVTSGCDGTWRVKDRSLSICCKALSAQPDWLQQFMLFPSWNYIPPNVSEQSQQAGGFLELSVPPVPLTLDVAHVVPFRSSSEVMGAADVTKLLQQRRRRGGVRLHVRGQVSVVCPLLDITGKSFFCFCLNEGESSVPILVLDIGHLCWQQCLRVGEVVCVSELRVCALRALGGRKVLCVTAHSRLSPTSEHLGEEGMEIVKGVERHSRKAVKKDDWLGRGTNPHSGENRPLAPPAVRTKMSKMISYKGVLSRVVDADAGIFEMDGQLGLCLAYQPSQGVGGAFRPGVEIEIHNAHFLYRASFLAPDVLLCTCLRSSLRVTGFSRLQPEAVSRPAPEAPALRILLEKNLGISQYLWLCHCLRALKERLSPRWVREHRVGAVASRLLDYVLPPRQEGEQHRRDIYREMLVEPHCCPLVEYSVDCPNLELLSVRNLLLWMERECWGSLSLASLLPPSAPYLTRAQLNPELSWSVHTLPAWMTPTAPVLVGMLEAHGKGVSMRLADQTGSVDCVTVESCEGHSYCAANNTAWLGCLVCVRRFTLVMERFLKTDFPSWTHLDDEQHIMHRHCRVYIQFCMNDVQLLSPSASMTAFLTSQQEQRARQGVAEEDGGEQLGIRAAHKAGSTDGHKDRQSEEVSEPGTDQLGPGIAIRNGCSNGLAKSEMRSVLMVERQISIKAKERDGRRSAADGGGDARSEGCVSVVFRVESKQGLAFRNVHTSAVVDPGRSLCFYMTVTMFGEPQQWAKNPRNCPLEVRETVDADSREVDLQFVARSVFWFPLLQVGCVYRLVAPHTQDPGVLRGLSKSFESSAVFHGAPCLLLQAHWRLYTLPPGFRPATLPLVPQAKELAVMSVSQVLYSSSAPALVSFQGLIASRITLEENGMVPSLPEQHRETGPDTESTLNVRLTIQDLKLPGQSIDIYLDLSGQPYIPGLVPGARVLVQSLQRNVSRSGRVYCRSIPISCMTVTALPQTHHGNSWVGPPVPTVLLGEWTLEGPRQCAVGRVRAHVTCVLSLWMQWACSLCGSIFMQDHCTKHYPACTSSTGVFQAEAKVAVDDGSGEAQIWISSHMVPVLLALGVVEWEGIQRLVRLRGFVRVYSQGRSMVSDGDLSDPLVEYLSYLCVSTEVCRSLTFMCKLKNHSKSTAELRLETTELKRFVRLDREFVTKIPRPLQLFCLELSQWEAWV